MPVYSLNRFSAVLVHAVLSLIFHFDLYGEDRTGFKGRMFCHSAGFHSP